jgi:hypothetical protein
MTNVLRSISKWISNVNGVFQAVGPSYGPGATSGSLDVTPEQAAGCGHQTRSAHIALMIPHGRQPTLHIRECGNPARTESPAGLSNNVPRTEPHPSVPSRPHSPWTSIVPALEIRAKESCFFT